MTAVAVREADVQLSNNQKEFVVKVSCSGTAECPVAHQLKRNSIAGCVKKYALMADFPWTIAK